MLDIVAMAGTLAANASPEELGRVMVRATAPVFLLSAVAGFISVLAGRLARIVDRIRVINRIHENEHDRLFLKADLPRLRRRADFVRWAITLALLSGIGTTLIVIFMFGGAFLAITHEWGAALLFIGAQALFAASLVCFALELRIGLSDFDNYE
ncbi:MAG: DUF2721 domain-containing protein [Rhodoblastus sp.]